MDVDNQPGGPAAKVRKGRLLEACAKIPAWWRDRRLTSLPLYSEAPVSPPPLSLIRVAPEAQSCSKACKTACFGPIDGLTAILLS